MQSVRRGEVETIAYNRDKGIGVTVYLGQRKGHASTSDFSAAALRETVEAALNIARFTAPDPCAGLPDAELLALWSDKLVHALSQLPELTDVASDLQDKGLQVYLAIDRDAASRLGVSVSDITDALYDALKFFTNSS